MAKEIQLKLKEGDKAPTFTVATSGGGKISLADYLGKNVILYFYPKDDTPGCTKEACAFRDHFADFKKKGAVVFGVSPDPVSCVEAASAEPGTVQWKACREKPVSALASAFASSSWSA